MRYFLFTVKKQYSHQTIAFELETFPSEGEIEELINDEMGVVILFAFEFKSKEDYESFTSKS